MRMNYKIYPTDYYDELIRDGNRKKAMAFHNYWHDVQNWQPRSEDEKNPHTYRFYAKAWGVSKDTASLWIGKVETQSGFVYEIALFNAHWEIKNAQHYSYVKKQGRQKLDNQLDKQTPCEAQSCGNDKKGIRQPIRQQLDKDFNRKEEEEEAFLREFEIVCSVFGKYSNMLGDTDESKLAYKQIREHITINNLLVAIDSYFKDTTITNFYSLPKLLRNKILFCYFDRPIRVKQPDGTWWYGVYYSEENKIIYDDGRMQGVADDVFLQFLARGDIEYVGRR